MKKSKEDDGQLEHSRQSGEPSSEARGSTAFLLQRVHLEMQERLERGLAPLGIRVPHYAVMTVLAAGRPASQIDVGCRIRFDRNKMVALVDELEARGLARRQANPVDRRAKTVSLTDAGRATLQEALKIEHDVEEWVLSPLKPGQRQEFQQLLKNLTD